MKSERAEAYINANEMDAAYLVDKDGCGWAVIGIHQARKAVEIALYTEIDREYSGPDLQGELDRLVDAGMLVCGPTVNSKSGTHAKASN